MNKKLRNGLIVGGVVAIAGLGLWLYTSIKKKNDASWRLLKLPSGTKKNRKIVLTKSN
jgi:hypothetical protein